MFVNMNMETFKVLYAKFIPSKRKAISSTKKRTIHKKSKKVQSEEDVEEDSENASESDSEISGFMSLDKLILLRSCLSDDIRLPILQMFNNIFRWGYCGHTVGHLGTRMKDNIEGGNNLPVSLHSAIMAGLNLINLIKLYKIEGMFRVSYIEE
jgi:hypothetical protein